MTDGARPGSSDPGHLRITEMYAFIAVDPEDGNEGIVAFENARGQWMPMVGADMERVEQLRPIAARIAEVSGRPITLRRFKATEEEVP